MSYIYPRQGCDFLHSYGGKYVGPEMGIEDLADQPEIMCRGGSAIISPLEDELAGPLYDEEAILYAALDLAEVARGKFDFDGVGRYARPDVFQLTVNEEPMLPVIRSGTSGSKGG